MIEITIRCDLKNEVTGGLNPKSSIRINHAYLDELGLVFMELESIKNQLLDKYNDHSEVSASIDDKNKMESD